MLQYKYNFGVINYAAAIVAFFSSVANLGMEGVLVNEFTRKEYKNSEEEAIKDIKNICLNKLSIRAVPEEFTIINAMPYTKMGKVDFKLLEKGYPENIEFEKKLTKTRKR